MVLLRRKAVLAVKLEGTVGTPETLLQADVVSMAYEPSVQFAASVNPRPQMASFGQFAQIPGLREATATFRTDLFGDGAGGVPAWADQLLPACGMSNTLGRFDPVSAGPSNAGPVRTATIGLYQDGRLKLGAGCAGTFVVNFEAGLPCSIDWTFTGKWVDVTDATMLADPATPRIPLRFADSVVDINTWTPCVQTAAFDMGNNVVQRECQAATDGSGIASGIITDRLSMFTLNPEAPLVAERDVYGEWWDASETSMSIKVHDAADEIEVGGQKVQLQNVQDGDRNGILIDDLTYQVNEDTGYIAFATYVAPVATSAGTGTSNAKTTPSAAS